MAIAFLRGWFLIAALNFISSFRPLRRFFRQRTCSILRKRARFMIDFLIAMVYVALVVTPAIVAAVQMAKPNKSNV